MWAMVFLGVGLGVALLAPVVTAVAITEYIALKAGKPTL